MRGNLALSSSSLSGPAICDFLTALTLRAVRLVVLWTGTGGGVLLASWGLGGRVATAAVFCEDRDRLFFRLG